MAAKLEPTNTPGVYRRHSKGCRREGRCECSYVDDVPRTRAPADRYSPHALRGQGGQANRLPSHAAFVAVARVTLHE